MAYCVNGHGCQIPIMAQGARLVRDQDYSAPGASWEALGRPCCLRGMRTVVWSFVARTSTLCPSIVERKRTSGARCSTSGAEEEEGEDEGEDEEKVEAELEEEERKKRRRRRKSRRRRRGGSG